MPIGDTARLIASLELEDKFSGPARNAEGALGRLEGRTGALSTSFGRVGANLGQMGRGVGQVGDGLDKIVTRGAIAAAGLGTMFVTAAASMEEAFIGVQKTVDETVDVSFEELRQAIRTMSSETGTAFEELARIGEVGGALGVPIDQLETFIDVVNRLAVSTDLSADQASTALGQLRTVLGLNNDELTGLADTLVALGNAGASTESQIVDLAARFAVAGDRAGLSTDEILALSSAVASMGIEVEAGGTALSNTFNEIAVAIGTGSAEVQGFTDLLGISAAEFRRRWEDDALGVFQEWLAVVDQLPAIEQAVAFEQAGITGARQQAAIGALADNYGFVADQLKVAQNDMGALNEESDKFFASSANGFRRVKENVRLSASAIGAELLPVVNELGTEFVTFLQDPDTQRNLKEFGENLAGGIRSFIGEIRNADFGPLLDTLRTAGSIAKGAFDAFNALPSGVKALALAAFGINKLTGGALSDIAKGFGNIFAGGIKIAFDQFLGRGSPANPVFVVPLGGGLGGGPTPVPTGGGGLGRLALGLTGVGLAAMLASEFEDEIDGLAESIHDSLALPDLPGPSDWNWPLGSKNPPSWLPDFLGGPGPDMSNPFGLTPEEGRAALKKFVDAHVRNIELSTRLLPGFSEARNVTDRAPTLPDTAMAPLTSAINGLKDVIARQKDLTGASEARNVTDRTDRIFVDDVKLDPSTVQDLREPTRQAAETMRLLLAQAFSADIANRTAAAFQTAELARVRSATVERLTTLAGKYDTQNAHLSAARNQLSSINAKTPPTHPVTVNNTINVPVNLSVSATYLEQRLVTARLASVGIPTAPTIL